MGNVKRLCLSCQVKSSPALSPAVSRSLRFPEKAPTQNVVPAL